MGAVRDLDVLIARFQKELTSLTEVEQADLRGLIEHLQQQHEEARQPMLMLFEELESAGFETEFLEFFVGKDF
jgi:CHAD domain-containing protein